VPVEGGAEAQFIRRGNLNTSNRKKQLREREKNPGIAIGCGEEYGRRQSQSTRHHEGNGREAMPDRPSRGTRLRKNWQKARKKLSKFLFLKIAAEEGKAPEGVRSKKERQNARQPLKDLGGNW